MDKCYTIMTSVFDLDENGEHFGDPVTSVQVADGELAAKQVLDRAEAGFKAETDEDGEPQDFTVERTENGLTATNGTTETVITVEVATVIHCEHVRELLIPKARLNHLNGLAAKGKLNLAEHDLPKYENIETWGVEFGVDGINADIKANTSEDDVWFEGVLFDKDNMEIACTEVFDKLDGEYEWTVKGVTFKVIVKEG